MRKEHKSKTGGLTAAGRAHFKRTEATFDWHFNAIDSDALKSREEIPRVPITTLTRFSDK